MSTFLKNLTAQKGIELMNDSNWEEASKCFKEMINKKESIPQAYFFLGLALNFMNLLNESFEAANLAFTNGPDLIQELNLMFYDSQNPICMIAYCHYLLTTEQYSEAIEKCNQVLQLNQSYIPALYYLGKIPFGLLAQALEKLQQYESALDCYNILLNYKQDSLLGLIKKGELLHKVMNLRDADKCYLTAMQIHPLCEHSYAQRCAILQKQQKIKECLIMVDKLLILDQNNINYQNKKAYYLFILRDYDAALFWQRKVIPSKKSPNDILIAYTNLGITLMKLKQYEEAIISFEKVIDIEPNNKVALQQKSYALFLLDNFSEAIEYINLEINQNGENPDSILILAQILFHESCSNQAQQYFQNFYGAYPYNLEAVSLKLHHLLLFNEERAAFQIVDEQAKMFINFNQIDWIFFLNIYDMSHLLTKYLFKKYETFFALLKEEKSFEEAKIIKYYYLLLKYKKTNFEALQFLKINIHKCSLDTDLLLLYGCLLLEEGALQKAIYYIEQSLQLDQNNFRALYFKSQALHQLENFSESSECINQFVNLRTNNLGLQLEKASFLFKQEQWSSAIQCLDMILEQCPQNVDIKNLKTQYQQNLEDSQKN